MWETEPLKSKEIFANAERGGNVEAAGRKSDVLCEKRRAGRSSRKPELIAALPLEEAAP